MGNNSYLLKKYLSGRWGRWTSAAALVSGAVAAGFAVRHYRRAKDLRWLDHAHEILHARTSNFRVIEGTRIHYQDIPAEPGAETLILIHGFCSSLYSWRDCILPLFKAGYRVISIDLKGYGFSEKPADGRYDVLDQANIIVGLMNALGIDKATLVGNSFGGAVSMAVALKYPERVNRLILISPAHNDESLRRSPDFTQLLLKLRGMTEIVGPLLLGSPRFFRFYFSRMYHDKEILTPDRVESYHRHLRTANCQAAALTTLRQWSLNWIAEEMANIEHPTQIIWGEFDWALPVAWGTEIHFSIKDSEFIVIPNCGHLPQEERSQDICRLILDFCERQPVQQNNVRQIKR